MIAQSVAHEATQGERKWLELSLDHSPSAEETKVNSKEDGEGAGESSNNERGNNDSAADDEESLTKKDPSTPEARLFTFSELHISRRDQRGAPVTHGCLEKFSPLQKAV